jgi:glycosyltransferase involved in cell wall biosynthesis
VIVPCYNVEAYIQECLESVVLQGDTVHHTYVVDNNSSDDTVNQVLKWHAANPSLPLTLLSEEKPGATAARNLPLARVETKWIQFLDADDLLMADKIVHQTTSFPEADVICAASEYLAIDGSKHEKFPEAKIPLALMKGLAGNTCANLFRTSAIKLVDGWDESLESSQETDLMFRLWQAGVTFTQDIQIKTTIRERRNGQISQHQPRKKWLRYTSLRQQMLREFEKSISVDQMLRVELNHAFFDAVRLLAKQDLGEALKSFNANLASKNYRPKVNQINSELYVLAFCVFGFKNAEILRKSLLHWRK